ncbi:MAG: PKD domain-containing protein, partial [Taibaiella sp.]|nr:PKD domain-containing protein [Taibaiella sp.]
NILGLGILLPSVLHWAVKNPAAAFSDKLVRGEVILNAVFPPLVRRLIVDSPTNFSITDPAGRKIEVRAGMPISNGIPGAFVSEKSDIMALAIPGALNGNYLVELVGIGTSVDFSLTFGGDEFHFSGLLEVGQTVSGEVTVSDQNLPPVVNAGPDRMVFKNQPAILDGSASHDPELQPLTFSWELLSAPRNSTASMEDSDQAVAAQK